MQHKRSGWRPHNSLTACVSLYRSTRVLAPHEEYSCRLLHRHAPRRLAVLQGEPECLDRAVQRCDLAGQAAIAILRV